MLLFPIAPFVWVIKFYSGNRKLMALLLFGTAIMSIFIITHLWWSAKIELQSLIKATQDTVGLRCSLKSISTNSEGKQYVLVCTPTKKVDLKYSDVKDMVDRYQEHYIDPIIPLLEDVFPERDNTLVIFAIATPSGFYACYKTKYPGKLVEKWHGSEDTL